MGEIGKNKARVWRKTVSALLILCMMLSFAPIAGAGMAGDSIEVGTINGVPGSAVQVAVYVTPDLLAEKYNITLGYDPAVLELTDVTDELQLGAGNFNKTTPSSGNINVVAEFVAQPLTYLGGKKHVMTLHFNVKSGAASGVSAVTATGSLFDSSDWLPASVVNGGVNVTAAATHTVTFEPQGGTMATTVIQATYGGTMSAPPTPTKSSNRFVGWYKEAAGTNAWNFGTDPVTGNMTLYAKWETLAVTIGAGSANGLPGATVQVAVTATSATYGLASYQMQIQFDTSALEVTDITGNSGDYFDSNSDNTSGWLRAAWADKDGGDTPLAAGDKLFTITFRIKSTATSGSKPLTISTPSDVQSFSVTDSSLAEMDKTFTPGSVTVDPTFTVTFDSQGGSSVASSSGLTSGAVIGAPAAPTKSGYTFAGWYKEAAGTNAWSFSSDTVTANVTLYAKWMINSYTVSFATDGGTSITSQTVDYMGYASKPLDPVKSGYTFAGWYADSGLTGSFGFTTQAVTANTTVYAKWKVLDTYAIDGIGDQTYADLLVGYTSGAQETKTITVKRMGTGDLTNVRAELSGTNADAFVMTQPLDATLNAGTPSTTFTVRAKDELAAGTYTATVTVSADSMTSVTFTVTQTVSAVEAPVIVSAAAGDGHAVITWNPVAGATQYNVFVSSASGSYGAAAATRSDSVYSYEATGLTNGSVYYFVVNAASAAGHSVYSNEVSVRPVSGNADLSDLTLSSETLTPSFDKDTLSYSALVTARVESITLTASASDSGAVIKVNGEAAASGQASEPIALYTGTNTITIEVTAQDGTTKKAYSVTVTKPSTSSSSPAGTTSGDLAGFRVIVNGQQQEQIATAAASTDGSLSVLTVTVDAAKLQSQLAKEGQSPVILIPVTTSTDKVMAVLTGEAVKAMEDKQAVLEIQTVNGNYRLPASEMSMDRVAKLFGEQVKLSDIIVNVTIAKSGSAKVRILENAANKGRFTVVAPPVDFTITASYNGKTVNAGTFSSYVERSIPLPEGVDPSKITTAIVLEEDGSTRHVPTYVTTRNGNRYAVVNSLTNSTYSLVWHPMSFADVEGHWAKGAVNDMASRMIVNGVDGNRFAPDAAITRAEFAAIIVRALGLADNGKSAVFQDVKAGDWYAGAVAKAREYGIVEGYEDGTFRPAKTITREEAMVAISRAMKLVSLETAINSADAQAVLSVFADGDQVHAWARQAVAATVKGRMANGSDSGLMPESEITRAETASMIRRMLGASKLIDASSPE